MSGRIGLRLFTNTTLSPPKPAQPRTITAAWNDCDREKSNRDRSWRWNGRLNCCGKKLDRLDHQPLTPWFDRDFKRHRQRENEDGEARQRLFNTLTLLGTHADDGLEAWRGFCHVSRWIDRVSTLRFLGVHLDRAQLEFGFCRATSLASRLYCVNRGHADGGLTDGEPFDFAECFWWGGEGRGDLKTLYPMTLAPGHLLEWGKTAAFFPTLVGVSTSTGTILARKRL